MSHKKYAIDYIPIRDAFIGLVNSGKITFYAKADSIFANSNFVSVSAILTNGYVIVFHFQIAQAITSSKVELADDAKACSISYVLPHSYSKSMIQFELLLQIERRLETWRIMNEVVDRLNTLFESKSKSEINFPLKGATLASVNDTLNNGFNCRIAYEEDGFKARVKLEIKFNPLGVEQHLEKFPGIPIWYCAPNISDTNVIEQIVEQCRFYRELKRVTN